MKRILTTLTAMGLATACLASATITDVTAQQRYPWNGKVDITYTVNGDIETYAKERGLMNMRIKVLAIDNQTATTNIATTLSGDTSLAEGTHTAIWDMNAQGLTFKSTNVVFNVTCEGNAMQYCIVDLSAGPNATSYPVSHTNEIPGGSWSNEYKQKKLALKYIDAGESKSYYIGIFEMTSRQYYQITGKDTYNYMGMAGTSYPANNISYDEIRGSVKGAKYPLSNDVDEDSFMGRMRNRTGQYFDLPSESQWEYACRAGTTTTYYYGDVADGSYMWYKENSIYEKWSNTYYPNMVGSKEPNAWGLYDMHGNVTEWCLEWSLTIPSCRVLRGGAADCSAADCTSVSKSSCDPSNYGKGTGFRVVVMPPENHGGEIMGTSNQTKLNLLIDARVTTTPEMLSYSTEWETNNSNDARAIIAVNGTPISERLNSGTIVWTPPMNGTYELTHKVMVCGEQVGETLTATFVAEGFHPDVPIINPASGTPFDNSLTVSITCASEGATIHYTTDGSVPTMESTAYTGKFKIYGKTTVKSIAFYEDGAASEMAVAEYAKGLCATPIISAPDTFTGSKAKVVISCETEGATVRYTTDGSEPNSHDEKYTNPFFVTESTTIRAKATKTDYTASDTATLAITREWGIGDTMGKPDHTFETSGNVGFVRTNDTTATLGESMRSGAIGDNQKSVLTTTVIGPGTLTFKWKASCEATEGHDWDHAEFAVDGKKPSNVLDGITDWIEVSQRINGEGEHTVTWTYTKDDVEKKGEDCLWVSDYAWASDYTTTQTTDVPVPYDWLTQKCRDVVDEYESYENVAKQTAYNPKYTVEQCYVAGLDPESATNEFTAIIEMIDGMPNVTWQPDKKAERAYKIWGSANLVNGGDWECPTNSLHRFFKVTVEMP